MSQKNQMVETYSENPKVEGRVLLISLGGAGIENKHEDINKNFKDALDPVPYLKDSAGKIEWFNLT